MPMTTNQRKFALLVHILTSVGLVGAIAVFLALAVAGLLIDIQDTDSIYVAMDLAARWVIVPLAGISLLSGLFESMTTPWGLIRHYWVLGKLGVTVLATAILLAKLRLIGYAALLASAAAGRGPALRQVGTELAVHAFAGLLVLLVPAVLSVYKPAGLTPWGRRIAASRCAAVTNAHLHQADTISVSQAVAGGAPRDALVIITLRRSALIGFVVLLLIAHIGVLHLIGPGTTAR